MANILVTNDDGIDAPGLLALVQVLRPLGRVAVVAPERNWSAGGHVKTLHRPLRAWEIRLADGTAATACDGAPSDCVALALLGLIPDPFDLVVAGVNSGANFGYDLTYSGTVTAAMESVIGGVPGIAVSLAAEKDPGGLDAFLPAAEAAARAAGEVLARGLPAGVLLNINVPSLPAAEIRGVRVTRQGMRVYRDELVRRFDPRGRPYFWIGGRPPTGIAEEGTDIWAVSEGFVSITPARLDLTAGDMLEPMREWGWAKVLES